MAAQARPLRPPEFGIVTLLTFLMIFALQRAVIDVGHSPSTATLFAAA